MTGGTIEENGIGVYVWSYGTVAMTDGTIKANQTGVDVWSYGTVAMTGGTIEENEIGVDVLPGGTFKVSGNPKIWRNGSGDAQGSKGGDVWLRKDVSGNAKITIDGLLTNTTQIGVSLPKEVDNLPIGTFTTGWEAYMPSEDPAKFFKSDVEGLGVVKDSDGEAKLDVVYTATADKNIQHGTITFGDDRSEFCSAAKGETVTLTAEPVEHYKLKPNSIKVYRVPTFADIIEAIGNAQFTCGAGGTSGVKYIWVNEGKLYYGDNPSISSFISIDGSTPLEKKNADYFVQSESITLSFNVSNLNFPHHKVW